MQARAFHLSDLLSIVTGQLLSTRHIGGIQDILTHMVGRSVNSFEIGAMTRLCAPVLRERFEFLREVSCRRVRREDLPEWVATYVQMHGEFHEVPAHCARQQLARCGEYDIVQVPLGSL